MIRDYTCNNFQRLLAECFDYAMDTLNIAPETFINIFVNSSTTKEVENNNPKYFNGMSGNELCETILTNYGFSYSSQPYYSIDRSPEFWAGDYIAYYVFNKKISFKYLFSFVSITTILEMYKVYHEMDYSNFTDELDRLNKKAPSKLGILRKKSKLSQSGLSILSNVPVKTIQSYEQKNKDINKAEITTVLNIAKILKCNIEEILEK